MKSYEQLTRLGRLRRLKTQAEAALEAYGLAGARLRFLSYTGNTTYRVDASSLAEDDASHPALARAPSERYDPHHYVLRMHQPGYQTPEAIASELEWLAALCRDTDLGVPEPMRTLDGELSVEVRVPGVPQPRRCSLLRWMTGRMLTKGLRPGHFRAAGRLMAGLHEHAAHWRPPPGFSRPRYDWDGLFGDNDFVGAPASEIRSRIPQPYLEPFETVTSRVRQVMDRFGQGPDAFGLIHADVSVGANVLFGGGEARVIDFDDCALGYWMFDLGVALSELRAHEAFPQYRDALRDGYAEVRTLPEEQWGHLDLFIATWHAFEVVWAAAGTILYPDHRQGYEEWLERAAKDMVRCLNPGSSAGRHG